MPLGVLGHAPARSPGRRPGSTNWSGSASRSNSSGGPPAKCTYFQRSSRTRSRQHCSIVQPRMSSATWAAGCGSPTPSGPRSRQSSRRAAPSCRNGCSGRPSHCSGTSMPEPVADRRHARRRARSRRRPCAPRAVGRRAGVADDHRHVVALVPPAELLHQPVVAHLVAVVGGEDHERVVGQAGARRGGRAGGRAGGRPRSCCPSRWRAVWRVSRLVERAADHLRRPAGAAMCDRPSRCRGRGGGGTGTVVGVVAGRGSPRAPGTAGAAGCTATCTKNGLVAVAVEPADHLVGEERRLGVLGREAGRRPGRRRGRRRRDTSGRGSYSRRGSAGTSTPCAVEPARPRRTGRRRSDGPPRGSRAARLRRCAGAGRRDRRRCAGRRWRRCSRTAPGRTRGAGFEGHVGEPGVERCAVLHRAVVLEVHAGVQRRPARSARRGHRPVAGERDAAGGQPIERRRLHHRMPEGPTGSRPATGRR